MPNKSTVRPLSDLAEAVAKHCRRVVEDEGGEVINYILGQTAGGEILCLLVPWGSDIEREQMLKAVREVFRERTVISYLHISEAWRGHNAGLQPSKDPEREECLMIVGVDFAGERVARSFTIKRHGNGKRSLTEDRLDGMHELDGSFLRLLDADKTLH